MATEQKYTDLMNAAIDGEIGDVESAELQSYLDDSAEGRAMNEQLANLCSTLDRVEAEEPPPHLRHLIMSSLSPSKTAQESTGLLQTLLAAPVLKYAATFAAGVVLSLTLVNSGQISNTAFDDVTKLVGTVAKPVDTGLVSSVSINLADIAGTVSLRNTASMLILDFDLFAKRPIEIEADYTDRTIWFNGFAQLESSGTTVSAQAGKVTLAMQGKRRYAVYLHNEGGRNTTIRLRFLDGGEVVHEARLEYAPDK